MNERPPLWIAAAALLVGLCAAVLVTLLIEGAGSLFGSPLNHPTAAVTVIASAGFDMAFVAAALYFTVLSGRMGRVAFGFRRVGLRLTVAIVATAGIGYYALTAAYSAIFQLTGTDKLPSEFGTTNGTPALVLTAIFVCVAAPIFEEFFFRGFLFGVLRAVPVRLGGRDLGPWVAAVLVGILFGIAHTGSASSSQYLIPLGFFGFVLCIVRWRTGSLYPCMILHSLNNALALGVNELKWGPAPIIALAIGSLAVLLAITLPLSSRAHTTASERTPPPK